MSNYLDDSFAALERVQEVDLLEKLLLDLGLGKVDDLQREQLVVLVKDLIHLCIAPLAEGSKNSQPILQNYSKFSTMI